MQSIHSTDSVKFINAIQLFSLALVNLSVKFEASTGAGSARNTHRSPLSDIPLTQLVMMKTSKIE
ncbi:hypothetical protein [secondary endosymbiont of Ctenarytaina eucalypti]|uniref:hypothetical protein n=1 Tax=secondary endosymbiont of Ctenarytaina eucalypti TaxID=1199245 RepID=UPI000313F958|nr:hypothetical protein [secondary endosymbiont of Ctenarytaina eucalypti]